MASASPRASTSSTTARLPRKQRVRPRVHKYLFDIRREGHDSKVRGRREIDAAASCDSSFDENAALEAVGDTLEGDATNHGRLIVFIGMRSK